jgi:5-formyltetrahydrofolate cyclo-ligase
MKNELKEKTNSMRDSLSKDEVLEKSGRIMDRLFAMNEYKNAKTVMFYVSFKNEVYTHDMIRESLEEKSLTVPKLMNKEIEPSLIIDFDSLVESGNFGILEPTDLVKVAHKNINLVVVPGIVFDKKGHRIGYGFGFYDKFLRKVPKAVKVGLCFNFQLIDKIPNEPHDVPVDFIVTDKEVVECKR